MKKAIYKLRLYIIGYTSHSQKAIRNLQNICDNELAGIYQIEIIDILEQPELAEKEKIMASPTLIKKLPEPVKRIVGDLSDRQKVIHSLEILREFSTFSVDDN